jgi:hypothetical protein
MLDYAQKSDNETCDIFTNKLENYKKKDYKIDDFQIFSSSILVDEKEREIEGLELKIQKLEKRIIELEDKVIPIRKN